MTEEQRERVAELSKEFYDRGDAIGWFDELYTEADGDWSQIPWADLEPNPHLVAWLEKHPLDGAGKKAVVVGCGLGDDAEKLAEYGFSVAAFDVAPKGIEWAKKLHPESKVNYSVADLFNLPDELKIKYDFVLEIHTIQALPVSLREKAVQAVAELVAPNGELLVICRGADEGETPENPPFPLRKSELKKFDEAGLTEVEFEDFFDAQEPPTRRFRVFYRKEN